VRFNQSGSAWRMHLRRVLVTLILSTLGLVYPFAQSRLERFKMRNTSSAICRTLRRLGFSPFPAAALPVAARCRAVRHRTRRNCARRRLEYAHGHPGGDDLSSWLEASGLAEHRLCRLDRHLGPARVCPPIPSSSNVLRWWTPGLRFGEVVVTSRLRTAQVLASYARFLL